MPSQRRHRHQGRRRLLRTVLVWIPLSLAIFSLAQVVLLKYVPVKVTPLMIKRTFQNIRKDGYRTPEGMCAKAPGRVSAIAGRAAATDISGLFKKTRKQK